ncbi:hypothetical protein I4F81_008423 [Pyropia yezoensis]|uniref:Uncharacterized protein n=1 Tax=Pyropia yezoensis TaxID=2788 RepID=A0ACC3C713_PYRYE|nr:hypothetical protein I4F81_008423 [Neopyropia yezoensis]
MTPLAMRRPCRRRRHRRPPSQAALRSPRRCLSPLMTGGRWARPARATLARSARTTRPPTPCWCWTWRASSTPPTGCRWPPSLPPWRPSTRRRAPRGGTSSPAAPPAAGRGGAPPPPPPRGGRRVACAAGRRR